MNGNSLQGAAGVGQAVADCIIKGSHQRNMLPFDIQRFTAQHNIPKFLSERAKEVVGKHYQLQYPLVSEFSSGRKIRCSTIHSELEDRGAVFGEKMGWEIPLYFDHYHHRGDAPAELPEEGSFSMPEFFHHVEKECDVCRQGVGIIDMSSLAKFIVKGEKEASVVNYLQNLCSNDVDIRVGGIVATGMLNEDGGYENDCLLVRRAENSFFVVSPTQQQTRIHEWMENHLPEDNSVGLQDVTSMYTVLSLVGPKSKDLMEELCGEKMDIIPFRYREVNVGYGSGVMVMAVTNTGEPGYTLYIPSEFALQIYDNFMKVGHDYNITNVGQLAMKFLRVEKFIPFWGEELSSVTTPIEVNRTFKVKLDKDKGSFIGKDALLEQKTEGIHKRLVQFHLKDFDKDEDTWPWSGESIYRDKQFVGSVTSSAFGFTLNKMVALGFVQNKDPSTGESLPVTADWINYKDANPQSSDAKWEIDIAGKMVPVSVHLHPPKMPIISQDGENASMTSSIKPKNKHYSYSNLPVTAPRKRWEQEEAPKEEQEESMFG